jgi:thioredoxin 1
MNKTFKIGIVIALLVVVGVVIAVKQRGHIKTASEPLITAHSSPIAKTNLPRLIDLGRGQCIPCKMMTPILQGLKKEYEGKVIIEIIDISDSHGEVQKYQIRVIPTQIFFDREGKEVYRHEGFMPREDIVTKFHEMGITE